MTNSENPSIAVVLPVYNVESYLSECLDSILDQTYKDFTVFAVNDGSTDGSGKILEDYALRDSRFVLINQRNGGLSNARNSALQQIEQRGEYEYVAFIDSDDVVEPNMLETLLNAIRSDDTDVAICGFYKFSDLGERTIKGSLGSHETISAESFVDLVFSSGNWSNRCGAGGMVWKHLYKANVISGLRFPQDRNVVEDEIFEVQVARRASKLSFVPQILYGYRQRPNSLVKDEKFSVAMIDERLLCVEEAKRISERSHMIAVAAYIQAFLSYCKNKGSTLTFPLPLDLVDKAYSGGFIRRKCAFQFFLLSRCPHAFRLYVAFRRIFVKK